MEEEVENGLNGGDGRRKDLVCKGKGRMGKVSDMVDLGDLNERDFDEEKRKGLKEMNQRIEKVDTLEREQRRGVKRGEKEVERMER